VKYILASLFINVINNEVLRIEVSTPEQLLQQEQAFKEAQVSDMLLFICNSYIPAPGETLSIQEVRKYNNVMTTLEHKYKPIEWMVFSEEELVLLQKVCAWTLPRMLSVMLRNADSLFVLLENAPSTMPANEEATVLENSQR